MKQIFIPLLTLASLTASAQCPFDPTITPDDLILCPSTQDVLTTQVYDSYQWYKDGNALPGDTSQTLIVDAFLDGGSMFSVEATLDGCTEMSPQVLVDGWAFLPPVVMTTGDDYLYVDGFGQAHYCPGDTVLLVFMLPYDTLIQWTDDGIPISGATNDTLVVTISGFFSVSGAPSLCPGFIQQLGVIVGVVFDTPLQPDIVAAGTQLCADPPGNSYQWYLNGLPLPGGDTECIDPTVPGSYVVEVDYGDTCAVPSVPYLVTGVVDAQHPAAWSVFPSPARDIVTITGPLDISRWEIVDITGRTVRCREGSDAAPITIDVRQLSDGRYWFNAPGVRPLAFAVVR